MLFGDLDAVKQMLRPNEATQYGGDIAARLTAVQKAVSGRIEQEIGAASKVVVYGGADDMIYLPSPAQSITTVTVGGSLVGDTVVGGTVYGTDRWTAYPQDYQGRIFGLLLMSGGWWGESSRIGFPGTPIIIEGDFSTVSEDDVPDDLTYAANLLILRTFQRERTGVEGVSGEDGSFRPPLDPWKEPFVKGVLARYRVTRLPGV